MRLKNLDSIRRILVIQFRPFGDVLLATAYLDALKERFPGCQIDFLVSEPFEVVVEGHPALTNILISRQKGSWRYYWGRLEIIFRVLGTPYDLIIDQADAVGARTIMMLTRALFRLGWENGKSGKFINLKAPVNRTLNRYVASRNWDMVLPLGIKEKSFQLQYAVKESSFRKVDAWCIANKIEAYNFICVAPGSPALHKRWHYENFYKLIETITSTLKYPVVVVGPENEIDQFKNEIGTRAQNFLFSPASSYNQSAALLARSALLVCNEGALNHLSVATKTPCVSVFGATASTGGWSPEGTFPYHYHVKNETVKSWEDQQFGVTVDHVMQKVVALLQEINQDGFFREGESRQLFSVLPKKAF